MSGETDSQLEREAERELEGGRRGGVRDCVCERDGGENRDA